MLNSNILDIALTLGFTYLMLSLIVSTVTEIFNTVLQRRSIYLQRGLKALFDNLSAKKGDSPVFDKVKDSPFIKILTLDPGWTVKLLARLKFFKLEDAKFPSYISSNNLSLAVLDALEIKNLESINYDSVKDQIKKKLSTDEKNKKTDEKEIRDLLLTILDTNCSRGDKFNLSDFITGIEKTFNDSMNRVTGVFKKKSQWISFIVSIIVVLLINVDSIKIFKTLQTDKNILQNAVTIATNNLSNFNPADKIFDSGIQEGSDEEKSKLEVKSGESDTVLSIEKGKNYISILLNKLNETRIPIGWKNTVPDWSEFTNALSISIFGWLISILAIYLGAPFWFDVLNKVTNLRGAGVKPKADATSEIKKDDKV